MAIQNQVEGYAGFIQQTVQGTGLAPTSFLKYKNVSFDHGIESEDIKDEGGIDSATSVAYVSQTIKNAHKPSVELAGYARPAVFPKLLAQFFGADALTGASDPWTHTITPASPLKWLSFERRVGIDATQQLVERFIDCRIDEMNIKLDSGKAVEFDLKALGIEASYAPAAPASTVYDGGEIFTFSQGSFTVDNLVANGTTAGRVTKAAIKFMNELDGSVLGGPTVKRLGLPRGHLSAEISFTTFFELEATDLFYKKINFNNTTAIANALYKSSTKAFEVVLDQALTPNRKITITLPVAYFKVGNIKMSGGGGVIAMDVEATVTKGTGALATIAALNGDNASYIT